MRLPEQKESLAHLSVGTAPTYDPFKAHEYYIRTRQLKPRQGAAHPSSTGGRTPPRLISSPRAAANPALMKQRAEAAAQVETLQKKLSQLNEALKTALKKEAEAKAKKGPQKPTEATKSEKARKSKQYRQAHKQELKTKAKQTAAKSGGGSKSKKGTAKKSGPGSSTAIKAAIAGLQRALAAAQARQRALG